MTTAVLERPEVQETDEPEELIHMCCTSCWPLPGPAMAFCGEWKDHTYMVSHNDPRPRCKECPKWEVRKRHQCR